MTDVFLSYSHKDLALMHRVCTSLNGVGLDVWTDEALEPGTPSWMEAIENTLENSRCLVVILTPDAKNSKWVKEELNYADLQNLRIFPILASGDEKSSIPFGFSTTQWIDIRSEYDDNLLILVNTLQKYLGSAEEKHELSERNIKRKKFWSELLEKSKGQTSLFSRVSPSDNYYIKTGAGRSKITYSYSIYQNRAAIELYIFTPVPETNSYIFSELYKSKEEIESKVGVPLDWLRFNRTCSLLLRIDDLGGLATPNTWEQLQNKMIQSMIRFDETLQPYIKTLNY